MDLEAVSQCNSEILCAQVAMLLEKKHEEEEEEKTQPFLMKPCYCALLSFSFSEDCTAGLPLFLSPRSQTGWAGGWQCGSHQCPGGRQEGSREGRKILSPSSLPRGMSHPVSKATLGHER